MSRNFSPGEQIGDDGRYRIIRTLGEGGMGRVYLAEDTRLNRPVAIKVLLGLRQLESKKRKRFHREALVAAKLNHPNLVPVYDSHFSEQLDMFVQEYVSGIDLEKIIELGPLNEKDGRELLNDLTAPLKYLHEQNLVHRDIKPANILKEEEGPYRLMDFGLVYAPNLTRMTAEGTLLGTLLFLPPEIALGEEATPASDIYQVGLVLHLAMTGHSLHAFPDDVDDINAMLFAGLNQQPIDKSLPKDIQDLIAACCHRDPGKRLQDGGELSEYIKTGGRVKRCSDQKTIATEPYAQPQTRSTQFYVLSFLILSFLTLLLLFSFPGQKKDENLFDLASIQLTLKDRFILTFPKGSLNTPRWSIELKDGKRISGPFKQNARGWRLDLARPGNSQNVCFTINTADKKKSTKLLVFPETPFIEGPHTRYGYDKFAIAWKLPHKVPLNLVIRNHPDNKTIVEKRGIHSPFTNSNFIGLGRKRKFSWQLRFENVILAQGKGVLGFNLRYLEKEPEEITESNKNPIVGAYKDNDHLFIATTKGKIKALKFRFGKAGAELVEDWSIPTSPLHPLNLRFFSSCGPDEVITLAGDDSKSTMVYGTPREHKQIDIEFDVSNVHTLLLPNSRFFCLFNVRGKREAHLALLEKAEAKLGLKLPGDRAHGVITQKSQPIVFVSENEKLRAHRIRITDKMLVIDETIEVGLRPLDFTEAAYDVPEAVVLHKLPLYKDTVLIAYQNKVFTLSEDNEIKEVSTELPENAQIKAAFNDGRNKVFLLSLAKTLGLTSRAKNQSRLCLTELTLKTDGISVKKYKTVVPAILNSVSRGRAHGAYIKKNALFVCSNSHFVVLDPTNNFKSIYTQFRYHITFRYGMFFFGDSVLLPSREGPILAMDLFTK